MVLLITLTGGGRTYRYATERTDYAQDVYQAGLLPITVSTELLAQGTVAEPQGISISLYAPEIFSTLEGLLLLPNMEAEVHALEDGDLTLVVAGRVSAPSYGANTEPILFAIKPSVVSQNAVFPPSSAEVNESTFNLYEGPVAGNRAVDPSVIGRTYPFVFGTVGFVDEGAIVIDTGFVTIDLSLAVGGTPGLLVGLDCNPTPSSSTKHHLLIAGHPVKANSLRN